MGRCLPIEVITQIKLRLDLDEDIPNITVALDYLSQRLRRHLARALRFL